MPQAAQVFSTNSLTNATESANNTETVVATLSGVTPTLPGQTVRLFGWVNIATGTGTTAGTLRIRKAGLAGTLVGPANADNQQVAASKTCELSVSADDSPGEGQFTYVLTYQGTGDTAVATFNSAVLRATVS